MRSSLPHAARVRWSPYRTGSRTAGGRRRRSRMKVRIRRPPTDAAISASAAFVRRRDERLRPVVTDEGMEPQNEGHSGAKLAREDSGKERLTARGRPAPRRSPDGGRTSALAQYAITVRAARPTGLAGPRSRPAAILLSAAPPAHPRNRQRHRSASAVAHGRPPSRSRTPAE